jgi:ribosomal protein S18 acetylase RimI-like enzyme
MVKTGNHDKSANRLSSIRVMRGAEVGVDPCSAIQKLASRNYGSASVLPISLLRSWYDKNPAIFRIALTSKNVVAGYLSSLPLSGKMFNETIDPDFQETSITAGDIHNTFYPAGGGVFISSIAVAPEYQERSAASLLLRLALIEDLIEQCSENKQMVYLSAQALSPKGEACMKSLGLQACGLTKAGWKIYYGKPEKIDLHSIRRELQRKKKIRCNPEE